MKNIITSLLVVLVSLCAYAQKDVTKFLGIPVDGTKAEMIQKLKAKGFRSTAYDKDVLEGEFNGADVNVYVVTNVDKVWRIMVADANQVDERAIQIRFNKLCSQFENNPKYMAFGNKPIPEDERIGHEMLVNKKRYEALFYQKPSEQLDTAFIKENLKSLFLNKYTAEDLENPTEEIKNDIVRMSLNYALELSSKKPVWFMISDLYGKYYITMFYDNEYNRANGEDL